MTDKRTASRESRIASWDDFLSEGVYRCPDCGHKANNKDTIRKHYATKHRQEPYKVRSVVVARDKEDADRSKRRDSDRKRGRSEGRKPEEEEDKIGGPRKAEPKKPRDNSEVETYGGTNPDAITLELPGMESDLSVEPSSRDHPGEPQASGDTARPTSGRVDNLETLAVTFRANPMPIDPSVIQAVADVMESERVRVTVTRGIDSDQQKGEQKVISLEKYRQEAPERRRSRPTSSVRVQTDASGGPASAEAAVNTEPVVTTSVATSPPHGFSSAGDSPTGPHEEQDLRDSIRHVLRWVRGLTSRYALPHEAEARKKICLECGVFGLEPKYLEIILTVCNECGVLFFPYGEGQTEYEVWRRKVQGGTRWILESMEKGPVDAGRILREMPQECRVLRFSDREIRVMVATLCQLVPEGATLQPRLTRPMPTNFRLVGADLEKPGQKKTGKTSNATAEFSSEPGTSSSSEASDAGEDGAARKTDRGERTFQARWGTGTPYSKDEHSVGLQYATLS